jgi:hypothetical protein
MAVACIVVALVVNIPHVIQTGEVSGDVGALLLKVIGTYLFGGLLGGSIFGLLRPLTRRRVGAVVVGVAATIPMGLATGFLFFGPTSHWGGSEFAGLMVATLLYGAVGGWRFWRPSDDSSSRASNA